MVNGGEPLVSIITLNYNQTALTCQFLQSTRLLQYKNYEIVVCDMASQEDPTTQIESLHLPNTRLLVSKKNLGFAAGNNWGIRHARGAYFLIINNDTEVTPRLIDELIAPFLLNKDVGATSPKIKFYDKPEIIQYAGFNAMNYYTGRTSTIGEGEQDNGLYDTPGHTHAAHGCAMMVSRTVLSTTGIFPEKFFLYYEEWDLSVRIIRAGYSIWYVPSATVFHKASSSIGKRNPLKTYYLSRNRILFLRRNAGILQFLFFSLFFLVVSLPKAVLRYSLKNEPRHLVAFLQGAIWNLGHGRSSRLD